MRHGIANAKTAKSSLSGIMLGSALLGSVVLLAGCGPNLSLTRATPAPVTVAPLRQVVEAVPASGRVQVRAGDSLYDIATRYQVTPQSVIQENNLLAPYNLRVGQSLKITPPRVHVVRFGDSVNLISQRYAVSPFQLAQLNNLQAPFELAVGQRLQLPMSLDFSVLDSGVPEGASTATVAPVPTKTAVPRKKFVAPQLGQGVFSWPVEGEIITEFGPSARGVHNDGVNISSASGAPVMVSATGTVAFVGENIKNFGKLVLVKHDGGIITAYAHLQDIAVREGQVLTAGDTIGSVGATGRVDRPQLHFEIRKSRQPIDPRSLIL
ncbi:M23 family metallopeptidase [Alphaproteobacteria bacterium]|nr:M23 family metallopeptidase [Alphaproteobacteria bacterium]